MAQYLKKNLKNFVLGFAIGTAAIIPGISGGTIAILLKIYDKIIFSINNLFKDFKTSFLYLLPIVIGIVFAIILLTLPITYAFSTFPLPLVSLFAGLIVGGSFSLHKELPKNYKVQDVLVFILSFLVAALLGIFSVLGELDGTSVLAEISFSSSIILFLIGFLEISAFIIPGISGSMLLLSIGFYFPILDLLSEFMSLSFNIVQLTNLSLLGLGALFGLTFIGRVMAYMMKSHRKILFVGILGFILGSIISLYVNYEVIGAYETFDFFTLFVSVIALGCGFFISKKLEEKR